MWRLFLDGVRSRCAQASNRIRGSNWETKRLLGRAGAFASPATTEEEDAFFIVSAYNLLKPPASVGVLCTNHAIIAGNAETTVYSCLALPADRHPSKPDLLGRLQSMQSSGSTDATQCMARCINRAAASGCKEGMFASRCTDQLALCRRHTELILRGGDATVP